MKLALQILSLVYLSSLALYAGETVSLFDGKTLKGWKTVIKEDAKYWSVIDGVITGGDGTQRIPHNSFLRTVKKYEDLSVLPKLLDPYGWNSYIVRCKGNHHETYINGIKVADYVEEDSSIPSKGFIGIQLHSGGNAKIEISDVTITEL